MGWLMRLKKIDDLTRPDHYYITPQDECFYLGEYTPGVGFQHSPTNQRIANLKKDVSLRGTNQYVWKEREISACGRDLRAAFKVEAISEVTWVPTPPSKAKGDPKYDDRIVRVLREMTVGIRADVREIVHQKESVRPSHLQSDRPRPAEIAANYRVDQEMLLPEPKLIGIVDDVLTAGSHFKAMKMVLEEYYPGVRTFGLFLARTERQSALLKDFDDL